MDRWIYSGFKRGSTWRADPAVPELTRRMTLSSCHADPVRALTPMLARMPEDGILLGDILADSGYAHRHPACAGRKLGYRFWPGLSCGGPVFVEQSAQTLSASDRVDPGRERDHVRFVFGSTQKHSVALVAAPGVVMGDVDVEHVV